MERILDFIKWSLMLLLLLVLAWAGLAATRWFPRPTDVQRKALAIISEPPATAAGRHNAFAAIWLSQYDIPAAELDKVADADLARYRAAMANPSLSFASSAEGRYRRQSLPGDFVQTLCAADGNDCLAKIRTQADATRQMLEAHAPLLDHARALSVDDHYHDRFPPGLNNPPPQFGGMGMLLLSDAALHFVDGDKQEGLARACSATLTWRTLASHSDSELVQAVAATYYVASSSLVAGMRAELPVDVSLPSTCGEAFAPLPDSAAGVCDTAKIEFAQNAAMLRQAGALRETPAADESKSYWSRVLNHLMLNGDAAVAYSAPLYASFCTSDADVQEEAARMDKTIVPTGFGFQAALFDPIGHTLALIGNPRLMSLPKTRLRMQNMQRMDLLVRSALGLGARPAGVVVDEVNNAMSIARVYSLSGEGKDFTIPLPASRLH